MSDNDNNKTGSEKSSIGKFDALVVDLSKTASANLSDKMTSLLESAQSKCLELSNDADSNEDQTRYFELMNLLRLHKEEVAVDFDMNIKEYLLPADKFDAKQQKQDSDDEELSLVEQDDMESIVLVKGIGERSAAKYSEQLSQLEARLEHLSQKTGKVFRPDALNPMNICQAFDDALPEDFDTANKKILFSMFEKDVANTLESLIDEMNQKLIDADILKKIKLSVSAKSSSSSASSSTQQTDADTTGTQGEESAEEAEGTEGHNISGFAMTAPPGANFRKNNQPAQQGDARAAGDSTQTGNNPDNAKGGNSVNISGGGSGNGSRNSYYDERTPDNNEFQHNTLGMPASQVGHVLSNYIGAPFNPDTTADTTGNSEVFPQSTPQHFGHQEIIQALSDIQNLPEFEQQAGERFDGEAIKQAVMSAIAKTSGGAVTKRINQIAEKTIDFIELIFDAIVDDENISDTIKALLLRLQIPIIKASMSDQEFFIYDDHPARELLDMIAEVGVGITEHTDETYRYLDKIVSDILGEYELTTQTFQDSLDKLKNYIKEQEEETRKIEEEEQQQLLRKHARGTVLKSLRAITTGKTLPEATHPLILKRWPTLMFNHYLKNGKENDDWVNIVLTLRHIVDSVQPIASADHLAKITLEKEALFEKTENYLNISSNSKKDVQQVMSAFMETVQSHIDDANFTEDEVSEAEEEISKAGPVEEAPLEEEVVDKPTIPSNIMPGMWFQVHMGEDRSPRRCKLSVILVEDANLMFVNHKGELIIEKSFDQFNEEIADGKTTVIMGHSAFENAFKTVINRLN